MLVLMYHLSSKSNYLVKGKQLSDPSTVSEKDLVAICNSRLGTFKSPDTIHFMDELPKGPSGKIQRMKLAVLAQ